MACPTCDEDTPSMRVLSKTTYVGHKRFLKKPHKWRRSLQFNDQTDDRDPPIKSTRDEILTQLNRLPMREKGKHPSYGGVKIKRNVLVELNWTKGSTFYELSLQQYLDIDVAKPIIELCLFFKQICSRTLIEDDMVKAESQLVDILCNLKQIYPPAFFDIMIHLVIHLPQEVLEGRPIPYRWIYPFERYMKKLKKYVQNKAKLEGPIAEGYYHTSPRRKRDA
ncbi:protein kinase, ATP binding site-containing protein [Tanacetum coccineum]